MTISNCIEPGCTKPAQRGLKICSTHYGRIRRGSEREGPIREWGVDMRVIPAPGLPAKVLALLVAASESNNISVYELQRKLVRDWLEKYEAKRFPYLCPDALDADPVPDRHHVSRTSFGLLPAESDALIKAAGESKLSRNGLVIHILEDWFRFWIGREHADGVGFTVSPFGPLSKDAKPPDSPAGSLEVRRSAKYRTK